MRTNLEQAGPSVDMADELSQQAHIPVSRPECTERKVMNVALARHSRLVMCILDWRSLNLFVTWTRSREWLGSMLPAGELPQFWLGTNQKIVQVHGTLPGSGHHLTFWLAPHSCKKASQRFVIAAGRGSMSQARW